MVAVPAIAGKKCRKIKQMELSIGPEYGCSGCRSNIVAAIVTADHNLEPYLTLNKINQVSLPCPFLPLKLENLLGSSKKFHTQNRKL